MVLQNDIDLLNPPAELEKRKHKLKRLVQSPNSFFMDVKCQGCFNITTVFSHSQTVVVCGNCQTVLCQPTGGRAKLTEGIISLARSFWAICCDEINGALSILANTLLDFGELLLRFMNDDSPVKAPRRHIYYVLCNVLPVIMFIDFPQSLHGTLGGNLGLEEFRHEHGLDVSRLGMASLSLGNEVSTLKEAVNLG
ncbi:hypothetical protein NC653_000820 [Populus alba x Populus x berolinensis]|uniref:40S ribosomal protein S27 n=1 Tax=Populus alba x Populus x berolinensis TaxID=444605 RepID=A0AAD6RJI5_9ROSI|nr:hypothetical protein NC653_000820 [Populus alba x Populus x berolinensis]